MVIFINQQFVNGNNSWKGIIIIFKIIEKEHLYLTCVFSYDKHNFSYSLTKVGLAATTVSLS